MARLADHVRLSPREVRFAPGFRDRAAIVLDGSWHKPRTVRTPTYLTDLGVRRFLDPEEFYRHHVGLAGTQLSWALEHPLLSPGEGLRRWVASAPDALVEHAVDALVVLAGGYGEAELVISEYQSSGRSFTSPWLAIYAATLASAEQPELALEYLDVARGLTDDIEEVFAIDLRSAAVAVKRRSDASGALNVLNELDAAIDMYPSTGTEPTAGDRSAMHAMVANLRALAHLNLAQPDQADASVREALTLAAADGLTGLTADRALRYRVQITGNAARLAWVRGDRSFAEEMWRKNVVNAREHDLGSHGEALFGLAYGAYLLGYYAESADVADEAILVIKQEASPSRLRQARKVLAASAAKLGDGKRASRAARLVASDPLGLLDDREH
jgi:tetratricopeptide (TPR) repeat protein